ncbi:hypothetical protein PSAE105876_18835 [Pseudomonas aeruginosa]|nr:hypothetical protein APA71_24870 [Pseudomonas aeruginosa]MDA1406215.1 hypothetical protein [Pseudomonas aeruginosa]
MCRRLSLEADQLSVTLSDHDGLLAIPPRGAMLHLWLGWSNSGLVDKGPYTIDETGGDYTGTIAYYRDEKSGTKKTITAGDQSKPHRLRYLYSIKSSAKRVVDREWKRLQDIGG